MRFRKKLKRLFGSSAIRVSQSIGYDIKRISDCSAEIAHLKSIKDIPQRLSAARELVRKYPDHPMPHYQLALCMHITCEPQVFRQFDLYGEVRRQWLIQTGLDELGLEFIWPGMVVGSVGNHYALEGLLNANRLDLRPEKRPFLLLSHDLQLRNEALFEYFEPYLTVIRNEEAIESLRELQSNLTLPLGACLTMHEGALYLDLAANWVDQTRKDKGLDGSLFRLKDNHFEKGVLALRQLGLPEDAWYVTLHVRQPGYRGENSNTTTENWRNVNPMDYLKAVKLIVKEGGWVFRMGDPSMTPLPRMPQVIDYAHNSIRSDWMDVFLAASCRFCIGTASGFFRIPRYFGVPVILTNLAQTVQYFSLREVDLFLPRLLRRRSNKTYLSFSELMSPPTSMFWSKKAFADSGLQWVDNSPEVLEAATREMLQLTASGTPPSHSDEDLQKRFKAIAEECGMKHGGRTVRAFANISYDFLSRHSDLLEGEA
jgi:putative glycosyltransferase (TIGR04372 family)